MTRFRHFAQDHPLSFSIFAALLVIALQVLFAVVFYPLLGNARPEQLPMIAGKLAAAACFVALIWRFGWLREAGITRAGSWVVWLITPAVTLYGIATAFLVFFGSLDVAWPWSGLQTAVAADGFTAGLLEEIAFRGLILYVLVRNWGRSRRGIFAAVLVSSLLFGLLHIINVALGRPEEAAGQMINASLSAIWYAAIVLQWGSVWPVVIIHGVVNAAVNAQAVTVPGFEGTLPAYLQLTAYELPLLFLGILVLLRHARSLPDRTDTVDNLPSVEEARFGH